MATPNETSISLLRQFLNSVKTVDMTHPLELGMPNWPTQPPYGYVDINRLDWGDGSFHRGVAFSEHTGTHMDAGAHFVPGTPTVDRVPLTQIMGRAVNVDATATPPRGDYSLAALRQWEQSHGPIEPGDIVFFRFGWDEKYGLKPKDKAFCSDWPGISAEVGTYLRYRQVKAVGTDTMALDADGTDYPCHAILLGSGITILENVDKLGELPDFFAVIGLALPFQGGSGSPIRLVAFLEDNEQEGRV